MVLITTETSLQSTILKRLNEIEGCKAINIHGNRFTESGTPDIIGCYRGKFFALECKSLTTNQALSDIQRLRIKEWTRAGGAAYVVQSWDEVKRILEGLDG